MTGNAESKLLSTGFLALAATAAAHPAAKGCGVDAFLGVVLPASVGALLSGTAGGLFGSYAKDALDGQPAKVSWPSDFVLNEHLHQIVATAIAGVIDKHATTVPLDRLRLAVEMAWHEVPALGIEEAERLAEAELPNLLAGGLEDIASRRPLNALEWTVLLNGFLEKVNATKPEPIVMAPQVMDDLARRLEEEFTLALFSAITSQAEGAQEAFKKLQILQINGLRTAVDAAYAARAPQMDQLLAELIGLRRDFAAADARSERRDKEAGAKLDAILAHVAKLTVVQTGQRVLWTVPKPSPYFTGHEEYLAQLRATLAGGHAGGITQPAGLKGLGGIGKSELALAYAHRHALDYDEAHFIVAESLAALDSGLARLMVPAGGEEPIGEQVAVLREQALRHLASLPRVLVVFDNVDEIVTTKEFQDVVARLAKAHVIVTCRHSDMGASIVAVPVEKMDEETGALYLLRLGLGNEANGPWLPDDFRPEDRDEARGLSRELDGLPLALHHAGAAVRAEKLTVHEVRADYAANRQRILSNRDQAVASTHPDSAWLTTKRALEKLEKADPAAAELVVCCAFIAPDVIFEWLFIDHVIKVREPLASSTSFANHRATALRSALIDRVPLEERLTMHRVAQAIVQDLQRDAAKRWMEIGNWASFGFLNAGLYRDCVAQSESAYGALLQLIAVDDPDALVTLNNLGSAYLAMGRISEAVELQQRSTALCIAALGREHRCTMASMNNLAVAYKEAGRYDEAIAIQLDELQLCKSVRGELHPDTLTSMSNLAVTYRVTGRHDEALAIQLKELDLCLIVLGERHRDTLTSRSNLASTYWSMGRFYEAAAMDEITLRLRRETLGDAHPDTLTSMNNLATDYYGLGRYDEARTLQEDTLRITATSLGDDHPDTITSQNNLTWTLVALNRLDDAKSLLGDALTGVERSLGQSSPQSRVIRGNMAELKQLITQRDSDR